MEGHAESAQVLGEEGAKKDTGGASANYHGGGHVVQKMPGEQGAGHWADLMHINKKGKQSCQHTDRFMNLSISMNLFSRCHGFTDTIAEWPLPTRRHL